MVEKRIMDFLKHARRAAVMGGTFDPIHYGHLIAAETVRTCFNMDKVLFIPSGNPPHKNNCYVSGKEHRFNMVRMATASNPYFEVSRMEIDREGSTYTVDTLRELKLILGSGTELFFVTGADAVLEILSWKNVDELLSKNRFIVVTRPGCDRDELDRFIVGLEKTYGCQISTLDIPGFEISSTDIRNRVSSNRSIKYLVPEAVEQYIIKNRLYVLE